MASGSERNVSRRERTTLALGRRSTRVTILIWIINGYKAWCHLLWLMFNPADGGQFLWLNGDRLLLVIDSPVLRIVLEEVIALSEEGKKQVKLQLLFLFCFFVLLFCFLLLELFPLPGQCRAFIRKMRLISESIVNMYRGAAGGAATAGGKSSCHFNFTLSQRNLKNCGNFLLRHSSTYRSERNGRW